MATGSKQAINRTRCKVRLVGFNDMLTEGCVFLAYSQRLSDLLNDDRDFLPLETDEGEVKVISKRAIMEVEVLEMEKANAPRASTTSSACCRLTPMTSSERRIMPTMRQSGSVS